jgi:hypothetical protein
MNKKDVSIIFLTVLMIAGLLFAHTPQSTGGMIALFSFSLIGYSFRKEGCLELMWFGGMTPVFFATIHLQAKLGPEKASWHGQLYDFPSLCIQFTLIAASIVFFFAGLTKYRRENKYV